MAVLSDIGLIGLAVMGQNLALNVAEKGFKISVYNRSESKTDMCVARAHKEGLSDKLSGYKTMEDFVASIKRPRSIIILVKAGAAVDAMIAQLYQHLEEGDMIIDGGNEWYENTERRLADAESKGILYMGMGVSGGEEGARKGPALMPGGSPQGYAYIKDIVEKVAAQVDDGPCVTYIGQGGAGNFVKMVHNGIEYGDMQLIAEAYDLLKHLGGFNNDELSAIFTEWNKGELDSFLIEITANILGKKDDQKDDGSFLVDKILDKTGMKGTGKWTIQQAAELSVAAPTMAAALDGRFLSGLKEERVAASSFYEKMDLLDVQHRKCSPIDKELLKDEVRKALYCSKICSYAQGMNIIRAKSIEKGWNLKLGEMARIWKGGCIIRAVFLDRIKKAYDKDSNLPSLLVDNEFASEIVSRLPAWRKIVGLAVEAGLGVPGMMSSLSYFDTYRRGRLPANLVQAQRDYFGSHTYVRTDMEGDFHTLWSAGNSADSITTTGYNT